MLKHGLYQFLPALENKRAATIVAWIVVIVLLLIGLLSVDGAGQAHASTFRSPPPTPTLTSPLATPTPPSLIEWTSPSDGMRDVPRHSNLVIHFRSAVDHRAIERGLTIEPSIAGTMTWRDNTLIFAPDGTWESGTTYQFSLRHGDQLLAPRWSYSIKPIVQSTNPGYWGTIDWTAPLIISFSEPMDRASVEAAFSIDPAVRGTFKWNSQSLVFTPRTEWTTSTAFTVVLSPTLRTARGERPIRSPYLLKFSTVNEEGQISFGDGPNVQVVDPDGRRAIQYQVYGTLVRPLTIRLYGMTIEQFLDRYSSSFRGIGPREDKHLSVSDLPLVRQWRQPITADQGATGLILPKDIQPGLYVLTLNHPAAHSDELIVIVTHDTLVLKQAEGHIGTWASRIAGSALSDMRIRVFDRDATLLAEGQTDQQGLFVTQVPIDPQPLIVIGERDGEITASGLSNEWSENQWAWWWQPAPKLQLTRAYIYTDRPIYRPGQTVHVKVIARYDNDAVYSRIPLEWDVIVRLRDARDNVVEAKTLHVNEYGTLNTSFDLAEGGTLGAYHIEAQIKDDVHRQAFKVEAYRKPEFEVKVQTDRANAVNEEPVSVTVDVHTYFGAPVANARVELVTYARQYDWWWYGTEDDTGGAWMTIENGKLTGYTDAQGRYAIEFTPRLYPNLFNEYRHAIPALIEATVTDDSGQAVSTSTQVVVHDAQLGLSASLPQHMYRPGDTIPINVLVHDIDGQPRANQPITIELQGWSRSGQYDRVMARGIGRTDRNGSVTINVIAPRSDWYRVEITGRDRADRLVTTTDWLWIYDPAQTVWWYTGDSGSLQISADKDRYVSGETAQLLIRTPVSGTALLSVERGRLRRAQMIELTTPTTLVPLTLQDDDAPNVYVAVNVYQPTQRNGQERWQSVPDANLLVARTNLRVSAEQRRLSIAVTPDRSIYGPRDDATFTIQTLGADGEPAQAELSFALVDESIYALSKELAKDPFEAFYAERDDIVRTYDSLRPVRWLGGGMGGGGGGDLLGSPRFNFPDTAYWNPKITTDENGRASVKVTLPDSLTRWRIVVRAVTAEEFPRVGEAVTSITTTQPIVIRPQLPRNLVTGDQVLLSAVIHNNTDRPRTAQAWLDADGLSLLTLDITRAITIEANSSSVVGWWAKAEALGTMTVTMRVKSARAVDAVRLSLPVVPLAVPDVQSIVGAVNDRVEHTIALPQGTIAEASTLQIDLSPSIAASVLDGLAYLTGYPFGCVEQTMSKALPNAVVGRVFNVLGVNNPALSADLPRKVSAGLQRLYGYQHNDGGWGWWFDDSTDDYQTAYVLFGLAMTKQAGYTVDQGVIDRGADYMTKRLPQIDDARTKAYALFALAIAGKGDLAATRQMTDTLELDPFSRAGIAIALHELGDEGRARQMIDGLIEEAVISESEAYWNTGINDGHYHEKTMSSSTRSTALMLDAIVRIRPDDPIVTKVVRWLMARRSVSGWGTTQETAYAVVALTDYLRATRELTARSTYRVFVNDELIQEGALSAGQMQQTIEVPGTQLRPGTNRVRIERLGAANRLYYKIAQHALIAGTTDQPAGPITVTRTYVDLKTDQPVISVNVGDVIQVKLQITLPDESWYVAIEDPLPGGLEGLNERLNTTSFAARQNTYEPREEFFYQDYGYNNKEVRDDRVVFFVTQLNPGAHTFTYLARATKAGTFNALPAQVYLMYAPEQWGHSTSGGVKVIDRDQSARTMGPMQSVDRVALEEP